MNGRLVGALSLVLAATLGCGDETGEGDGSGVGGSGTGGVPDSGTGGIPDSGTGGTGVGGDLGSGGSGVGGDPGSGGSGVGGDPGSGGSGVGGDPGSGGSGVGGDPGSGGSGVGGDQGSGGDGVGGDQGSGGSGVGGDPGSGGSGVGGDPGSGGSGVGGDQGSGGDGVGGDQGSGGDGVGGDQGSGGDPGSGGTGTGGSTSTEGCGASTWPDSGRYSIDVSGTTREYILTLPDNYDPSQQYRLIFGWHWRGGSADQVVTGFGGSYYGLVNEANGTAIFVAPEGLDQGWANTGGRDIEFLRAMLDRFRAELCIDEERIFSTGFSYGGMMSFAVGCAMGDVFRAIAPMSGALYSGCENGDHPVAMWGSHGDADDVVPLSDGEAGRDVFLERNGCGSETVPVDPSPCVSYQGCADGYPVTWCEFSGGHGMPDNMGPSIWAFFSQF